ncbi:hypothetical protein V6N12_046051 [Hibiscus sabdariffa]|uniref:Uncharacterized protein n=1 Tax=Hibiscus sabdariffa TaxID=183260 RepID=A0ABR2G4H1_9ROSI
MGCLESPRLRNRMGTMCPSLNQCLWTYKAIRHGDYSVMRIPWSWLLVKLRKPAIDSNYSDRFMLDVVLMLSSDVPMQRPKQAGVSLREIWLKLQQISINPIVLMILQSNW